MDVTATPTTTESPATTPETPLYDALVAEYRTALRSVPAECAQAIDAAASSSPHGVDGHACGDASSDDESPDSEPDVPPTDSKPAGTRGLSSEKNKHTRAVKH